MCFAMELSTLPIWKPINNPIWLLDTFFFKTIANLSIWCPLQFLRQGYKCERRHSWPKPSATSAIERSNTKVRPITAYSSRHLSPPWNTHKEKRSKNSLVDANGSTSAGYGCLLYPKLLSHQGFLPAWGWAC